MNRAVPEAWRALPELDGVAVGDVAAPRSVAPSSERVRLLRESLRAALGEEADEPLSLADVCPDPLVFALDAGLGRPQSFPRGIDDGSEWEQLQGLPDGELTAVSAVVAIEERVAADGRRMARVVYQNDFYDTTNGVHVGVARGTSLNVGPPA